MAFLSNLGNLGTLGQFDDYRDIPSKPSPPTRVCKGHFLYDGKSIYAHGHAEDHPASWREYFSEGHDDRLDLYRYELSDEYLMSRLEHYGLPYDLSANRRTLLRQIKRYLREGKFDSVPDSVLAVHDALRAEWKDRQAAYKIALQKYEVLFAEWRETRFASKSTLSEKAGFDPELFLQKYYLDDNGQPDPTKTPDILVLEHCHPDSSLERDARRMVPGLSVAGHFSLLDGVTIAWIGWNASQVKNAKAEFIARIAREGVERRIAEHHQYLADSGKAEPSIFGRYLMKRPPGVFEAIMEFGMIEGKMLLSTDKEVIRKYVEMIYAESDDDEDFMDNEPCFSAPGKGGENTTIWSQGDETRRFPMMYHFVWKGGNFDEDDDNHVSYLARLYGRILFEDQSYTKFGGEIDFGEIDLSIVEGKSFFGGGKTSDSLDCEEPYFDDDRDESDLDDDEDEDEFGYLDEDDDDDDEDDEDGDSDEDGEDGDEEDEYFLDGEYFSSANGMAHGLVDSAFYHP